MGREARNKQQNCEDSYQNVPEQIHYEEVQGEPVDPNQEQAVLPVLLQADLDPVPEPEDPVPEPLQEDEILQDIQDPVLEPQQEDAIFQGLQDPVLEPQQEDAIFQGLQDPAPEPQQEDETIEDLQADPAPDPPEEGGGIHQDSQVDLVPNQELEDTTVQCLEVYEGPVVEQEVSLVPQEGLNIEVKEEQEVLPVESVPDVEDQEGVPPFSQENSEQEVELQIGVAPTSQESPETEVDTQVGFCPISQESAEIEVETQVVVPPVSQESLGQKVVTQVVPPVLQGGPEPQVEVYPAEIQQGDEISVFSINLNHEMEANVQQKQVHLIDENIVQENEVYSNIVPTISDFLRPIFDAARIEILHYLCQRQNIYIVPMIIHFLQQILEEVRRELLVQMRQNIVPVASELRTSSEESGRIFQQSHQNIMHMAFALQPWEEILQQILNNILTMGFEFPRSSREGSITDILLQILFLIVEHTRCIHVNMIDNVLTVIVQRQFTAYHRIQILPLLFRLQFSTTPRLLLVEPPFPLSTLVASAPLLALRGIRHFLGLEDICNLPALEGPNLSALESTQRLSDLGHFPLLSSSESPLLSSSPEALAYQAAEDEMCSSGKNRKATELQETSEPSSVRPPEAAEALAICPRKPQRASAKKRKKRTEPSKPGYADTALLPVEYQERLEYENEEISDPGEPDISDPIELLKDLNFGEMNSSSEEMKLADNLELGPIEWLQTEAEKDLETEASGDLETEASGDLETEASEDLETEVTEADSDVNTEPNSVLETETSDDLETEAKGDLEKRAGVDVEMEAGEDLDTDDEDLETDDEDLETDDEDLETDDVETDDEDLDTDDEDLDTENREDLGIEECQHLLPPTAELPYEDVSKIPEEPEEAPNAALPNDEGNRVFIRHGRGRKGEARAEEQEGLVEEAGDPDHRLENVGYIISVILFIIVLGNLLNILSYVFDWRGLRTKNETTPIPVIDSNATTYMKNITSLDYDGNTSHIQ